MNHSLTIASVVALLTMTGDWLQPADSGKTGAAQKLDRNQQLVYQVKGLT